VKRPTSRRNRGFTLIEVLLVLVILVVLASLATVNILSARRKALAQAAKTQVLLFDRLLDSYQMDIGTFPSNLQGLRTIPADIPDPSKWAGPYIDKEIPLDPWGRPYQYAFPGQHSHDRPDVWTLNLDTNQEIGNWEEMKQ
jgi:general secretion pathway protein G